MICMLCSLALAPSVDAQLDWLTGRLQGTEFKEQHSELVGAAPGIFPLLGHWLARPGGDAMDIRRVYVVLRDSPGDRSRFLPQAVQHLAHSDPWVRVRAAEFIGRAGTPAEATPLLALVVADPGLDVFNFSLAAIERIGDERTAVALELWLRFDKRFEDRKVAEPVQAARSHILARLDAEKKAKPAPKP